MKIAIVGFGNVGKGVVRALERRRRLRRDLGLSVVGICDLWGAMIDENGINPKDALEMKCKKQNMSAVEMIRELDFDVLVEATPTNVKDGEPGLTHITEALRQGKHVVTSNKGPLVVQYRKLMNLAKMKGVHLRFEATVGGAMPVINLVRECLAGNEILAIRGVLNGTTNYILTRMAEDKMPYEHILSEAKELGIAEADPSYDVDGIDAACKLVILANSIFEMDAKYKDVSVTGISWITPEALFLAEREGYTIRLIAEATCDKKLSVAPRLVRSTSPLAVRGTLNAISVITDLAGEITVTGKGAGPLEAASSILSDLIYIARSVK